ncbi:tripartite tricarboxylate transporter TctB family protein [Rhizobium sullae]|uniref:Putative tricarboxylic transport membrane protein n=1 Tax=Rhizobium sullae TaxID=50338 RepID=A0A2N0D6J0_RHISU|nr:tripartite tricarboxylate transporter TctB family protein [Rhizobium sullae]PKA41723.1 tripartite tricarboxylate transporter TctB family protein [Rhizobium sullae]TCU15795.1 putative tricarboxylic transport membrane protein [Rhizobium sullae]UWU13432.1 tripartite tricarboxylate transporter TctB family protein [Rhizobium sullae]
MSRGNAPLATKRRPDWAALIIAICLFVVAAVMLWDATHMRAIAQYARIGPATAPKVVAFGLIGLGIWTVFEALRGDFSERERQEVAPVIWIVAGLAAQMLLLKTAGFSIATGILFAFTARGFGRRKLWLSIPFGIVFSFIVWAIFSQLLQLTLPAGPLERLFF